MEPANRNKVYMYSFLHKPPKVGFCGIHAETLADE